MVVQRFLVNGIYVVFPWNQSRDDEYHQPGDSDGGFGSWISELISVMARESLKRVILKKM